MSIYIATISIYGYFQNIDKAKLNIDTFDIFWKFFNSRLHSMVFVVSFMVGLGFVMITLKMLKTKVAQN